MCVRRSVMLRVCMNTCGVVTISRIRESRRLCVYAGVCVYRMVPLMQQCGNEQSSIRMQMKHFEAEWNFDITLRFLSAEMDEIREYLSRIVNEIERSRINGKYKFALKMIIFIGISSYITVWNEQQFCNLKEKYCKIFLYPYCGIKLTSLNLWN